MFSTGPVQSRLDVESELSSVAAPNREPARARLTFRGRPVVGQHGIFAEFGAKATSAFADAVAKVAAGLSGPLASMGPIPNRDESRLLITGTALGSFGFELEEMPIGDQLDFGEDTSPGKALELTQNLLLKAPREAMTNSADSACHRSAGHRRRPVLSSNCWQRTKLCVPYSSRSTRSVQFNDVG